MIRNIQEVRFMLLWATNFYRAFLQGATPSVSSQCDHLDTQCNTPSHSEVFPESGNPETVEDPTWEQGSKFRHVC